MIHFACQLLAPGHIHVQLVGCALVLGGKVCPLQKIAASARCQQGRLSVNHVLGLYCPSSVCRSLVTHFQRPPGQGKRTDMPSSPGSHRA